jgi:hypothetical protein
MAGCLPDVGYSVKLVLKYIYIYIYLFNLNWVDTQWQMSYSIAQ